MPPRSLLRFSVVLTSKPTARRRGILHLQKTERRCCGGRARWRVAARDIACSQDSQSQLTPPTMNGTSSKVLEERYF